MSQEGLGSQSANSITGVKIIGVGEMGILTSSPKRICTYHKNLLNLPKLVLEFSNKMMRLPRKKACSSQHQTPSRYKSVMPQNPA
jgi:hypothetical protein